MLQKMIDKKTRIHKGFVLLLTLVLLIVFSVLGYILSSRLLERRSRNEFIVDYAKARYACDSAIKYAIAAVDEIKPRLIERPNEPDFSDVFQLTEAQYEQFLADWAEQNQLQMEDSFKEIIGLYEGSDFNDINDFNNLTLPKFLFEDLNQPDSLSIRGPYGPAWPLVTPPIEFEIGSAKVKIEIEDENAKYPLGWAVIEDENIQREIEAGFQNFFESMWSDVNNIDYVAADIDTLKEQLEEVKKLKRFNLAFKDMTKLERRPVPAVRTGTRRTQRTRTVRTTIPAAQQKNRQSVDFVKIFHSSLLDNELLARPTVESETRKESALKYLATWSSTKVNINTAPRHVLEAAFIFGGNEVEIANEIILRRRIKPFANIDDLKKELLSYSNSIEKCENFITAVSSFFTIRITVTSGVAQTSAVIAVSKEGNKINRIAVVST